MKKQIYFNLVKGQSYQTRTEIDAGEIQLNTGVRTSVHVHLKEGDQKYALEVITTDIDGSNPVKHLLTIDNAAEPIVVKKYKNLSFHLKDGSPDTSYTFELDLS